MSSIPISRPIIGEAEIESVASVMRSGMLASGAIVREFESAFAEFVGTSNAVAVSSGTSALIVGLLAAGIGPGDEVVVPSFTFAATANAVALVGAKPVFADVDDISFCISAATVEPMLTSRTKAVMPVHMFGHPAPTRSLEELLNGKDVLIVEDAAQAHGASRNGANVGALGRFAAFSFYATKNMTTGEGGMITSNDSDIAGQARLFRNQGMEQRYTHEVIGLNERMTEIEAAIGLGQLARLPEWTAKRRENAARYDRSLSEKLNLPRVTGDSRHVYHQYTIRPPDRDRAIAALEHRSIGYGIYYPIPVHLQRPYRDGLRLPVTERLAREVLSIPVRPDLTSDEQLLIIDALNEVAR